MSDKDFAKDYVDVAERLRMFRDKHPEGSIQPANHHEPIRVMQVGDKTFLQYVACAYRSPDDPRPGVGIAWEPFPGKTPFTRDSEAMVAETSAWGRAIVAVLAADTKRGVASADEVRNARQRQSAPAVDPQEEKRLALINEIGQLAKEDGNPGPQAVLDRWAEEHGGEHIKDATDVSALQETRDRLHKAAAA